MGKEAETIRTRFPGILAVTGAHQYETVVGAGGGWAQQMKAGGYLAMALIDNLEWVAWQVNAVEQGRITDDGT